MMSAAAAQRDKFTEKVHKPPLWVNVINFELNGLDASVWVPWSPSDPYVPEWKFWLGFW